jgi:hypothetical protein
MELRVGRYGAMSRHVAILLKLMDRSENNSAETHSPSENDLSERAKQAFTFASDVTKQLMTLSTGVVALTITFSRDILGGVSDERVTILFFAWQVKETHLLASAWLVYLVSIIFGIATLMTLTGNLDRSRSDSVYAGNIRLLSMVQIVLFLVATFAIIRFGIATV